MKFCGMAGQYYLILSGLEAACAKVQALANEEIAISLSPDFGACSHGSVMHGPTVYDVAADTIRIGQTAFDRLPMTVRRGFVLHEVAHAIGRRNHEREDFGPCIDADLRAMSWGLLHEIFDAAVHDGGPEYGELLRKAARDGVESAREALELPKRLRAARG
jgi:hypothetical protein